MYSKIIFSAHIAEEVAGTAVSGLTKTDSASIDREGRRYPTLILEDDDDCWLE
jgi:hypothetical protein